MSAPRITVAIPTFDGGRFLRQALASVLAQSLADFELLVVDDASRDDTESIVRAVEDPRLRLVRNPQRLGLVGNWNRCLELARAPLVTVFHQDDVMAPENLSRKAALLDAEPDLGMAYSGVRQIGESGELLSEFWHEPPRVRDAQRVAGMAFFSELVRGVNPVCAPSVVLRRRIVDAVGGFDRSLPFTADWEMWMRVALHADVGFVPDALVDYRRHAGMETNRYSGAEELRHGLAAKRAILGKYPERLPDRAELAGAVYRYYVEEARQRAVAAVSDGRRDEALAYLEFASAVEAEGLRGAGGGSFGGWALADLTANTPPPALPSAERFQELQDELAVQRGLVAELRSSLSWRLTAPLRWLGARVGRGRR